MVFPHVRSLQVSLSLLPPHNALTNSFHAASFRLSGSANFLVISRFADVF
jgi:hypothetical protein